MRTFPFTEEGFIAAIVDVGSTKEIGREAFWYIKPIYERDEPIDLGDAIRLVVYRFLDKQVHDEEERQRHVRELSFKSLLLRQLAEELHQERIREGFKQTTYDRNTRQHTQGKGEESMRPDWDTYFMDLAHQAAKRATCDRKHVGAVITRNKSIIATGFNGSIRGLPHCDDVGHLMEDGHCVRTVHAEANAIAQAARNGATVDGGTIYVTASPCWPCFRLLANAGIIRIVFNEFYRDQKIFDAAIATSIELFKLTIS